MNEQRNPFLTKLTTGVHNALKQWHKNRQIPTIFAQLYLFRTLHRALGGDAGGKAKLALNQLLLTAITQLQEEHEQEARYLHLRFLDNIPMHRVTNQMNAAESTLYALQRQAIEQLAELIWSNEMEAVAMQKAAMVERLEAATYTALVGVEEHLDKLKQVLTVPEAPWLISIEGMGGIGKTSLTDALLRRVIEEGWVDDIGWVSARRERLSWDGKINVEQQPALTAAQLIERLVEQLLPTHMGNPLECMVTALHNRLHELPHIIVIDNLETLVDVETLLPTLQKLANPSKFVLTSRHRLYSMPNIYHFIVPELSEAHALTLIRQEANLSNLPELAMAGEAALKPIYATVGGNPLALRLVVGQAHILPLDLILTDLGAARSDTTDHLYTYIYQQAWQRLNELSRQVLLIMPLASPMGEDIHYLAEIGAMAVDELRLALNKLVTLNLVDARGGINERRYSIHGLTRTFLQEEVLHSLAWESGAIV
ncbi:MAG: NB-ARC domain-containing protein [Caldilineaceae bacterium]